MLFLAAIEVSHLTLMLAWFRTFCEEGVANFFIVILSTVSQVFNECKCLFSIDQQWDDPIKKKAVCQDSVEEGIMTILL